MIEKKIRMSNDEVEIEDIDEDEELEFKRQARTDRL
jgi:hypothetical protein